MVSRGVSALTALCVFFQACVLCLSGTVPDELFNTVWTYNESAAKSGSLLPPSKWKNSFGSCDTSLKSELQSPIDIQHLDVPLSQSGVLPLTFKGQQCAITLRNIGATISAMPSNPAACGASFTTLSGTNYKFYEAHLHWHKYYDHRGTEHKVDGQGEAVEAHIVHYNSKFKSIDDAFEDGNIGNIAVFAVRYTVAPSAENATEAIAFDNFIAKTYPTLRYMDLNASMQGDPLNPYDLIGNALPHNESLPLYHYNGSLTTPRCDSIVSWYIVQQTVMLSQSQVHQLRFFSHVTESEEQDPQLGFKIDANVRPVAPINSRLVVGWPAILEPNVSSDSAPGDDDNDSNMPTWELAAIICGSVLGAAAVMAILVFVVMQCRKKSGEYSSINSSP